MTAAVSGAQRRAFCSSCVNDQDVDPQTGRCLKCGYQAVKQSTEPKANGNNGAPGRGPSQAYRGITEPFNPARSVAALEVLPHVAVAEEPEVEPAAEPVRLPPAPSSGPPAALATERSRSRRSSSRDSTVDHPGEPTARWIADTRALADGFLTRAAAADRRVEEARAAAQIAADEAARFRKRATLFTKLLEEAGAEASDAPSAPRPTGASTRWSRSSAVQVDACIDCGRSVVPHVANGRCRTCDGKWRAGAKS